MDRWGDGAERRVGDRMRQSLERVWSASLELEALEQEVMRHSPDRGPRDLKVTAAATELTTSAPAACARACLRVGASASVCARACQCVCPRGSASVCTREGDVCECACEHVCGGDHANVPVHVRPVRNCLSVCTKACLCVSLCACMCMWARGRF